MVALPDQQGCAENTPRLLVRVLFGATTRARLGASHAEKDRSFPVVRRGGIRRCAKSCWAFQKIVEKRGKNGKILARMALIYGEMKDGSRSAVYGVASPKRGPFSAQHARRPGPAHRGRDN